MMHRRAFIRSGALFVPALVGLPRKSLAQMARTAGFIGAASGAPPIGGGDSAQDSVSGTTAGSQNCGDVAGDFYVSTSLPAAGSSYTAHQITLRLSKTASPTGTLSFLIFSDSIGTPGSVLTGGTSDTMSASALGASEADATLGGLTASIVSGTKYHVALKNTVTDASNFVNWHYVTLSTDAAGRLKKANSTPSWSNVSNTHAGKYTILGA